jgi:hypothetical protein
MNVSLNQTFQVTLSSGFLVSEGDGIGTIQFKIQEQPVTLAITSSNYSYNTPFVIGNRVKLIESFGSLGVNSEGILNQIIIDSTDDKCDVFFDTIYPDQNYGPVHIEVKSSIITSLYRVPLRILAIV